MTTPCYNSRCADEYAHQQGLDAEREEAIEREICALLAQLDDIDSRFSEAVVMQMSKDAEFSREIDDLAWQRIQERNQP